MSAGNEATAASATESAAVESATMSATELAQLTLSELIAKLEPIPEPTPISYFPETPIWLWLAAGLACILLLLAWLSRRRWRARAYRRTALAELRHTDDVAAMANILRRAALAAYPRDEVAGLIGEEWLAFLDGTLAHRHEKRLEVKGEDSPDEARVEAHFRTPVGRVLLSASYVGDADLSSMTRDAAELRSLVERWVRDHRVDGAREAA